MREWGTVEFLHRSPGWILGAVILGAAGLFLLWLGYRGVRLPGRLRAICFGLKAAALLLLVAMLLNPVVTGKRAEPGMNGLAVLVDEGESMQLHGADEVKAALALSEAGPGGWRERLEEDFAVEVYGFGTGLRRLGRDGELAFEEAQSNLGQALKRLQDRYRNRSLAGVVLFTDGNVTDRAGLEALALEVPVFPVMRMDDLKIRDLSLGAVSLTETAFEDAPVTVTAEVRALGLGGTAFEVVLLDGNGKEVARETRAVGKEDEVISVTMRFRPVESGVAFYRAEVRSTDGKLEETTERNNAQALVLDRGRGPYRVLYLSGRPNWEYKFLRRALSEDPEVELVGLVRVAKREPKFEWRGRRGESSNPLFRGFQSQLPEEEQGYDQPVLIRLNTRDAAELAGGFPKERESLFADYAAVIVDDLEAEFFTEEQQVLVEKFVTVRGGSLLMLGGQESLQEGGYDKTRIGDLLPVYLDGRGEGPGSPVRLELTREGWLEPWARLRLTEEEESRRLASMPPFLTLNSNAAIKPGANLVAVGRGEDGSIWPALSVQRAGEGRVAALAIGDVWRWAMEDEEHRGDMERWWRQILRWLVADVPPFLDLETGWEELDGVMRRSVAIRLRDDAFRPEDNATIQLEVQGPEDEAPRPVFAEPSLEEAGLFTAEVVCAVPGAYRLRAVALGAAEERLHEAEAGWSWNPLQAEYASLGVDREWLEALAERSGGAVVDWDRLEAWSRELPNREAPVMKTWERALWHDPLVLMAVLGLLSGEWALRRWKGLA